MTKPNADNIVATGILALPDIISRFFQTSLSSFLKTHEQLSEKLKSLGKQSEAYRFDNLDQASVKAWSEFYDKEIRQYLKVPKLGLVRFHQERFNQTIDTYNIFSSTLAEFMQILMLPMEKTFKVLHEKIEEQIRNDSLPDDPHAYYRMWLKILEGHYMILFKSPKYTKSLGKTLNAYEEYLSARNQIFTDAMQSLPIPTNKDLDELYSEIYHIKKRMKELEKSNKELKKSVMAGG